MKNRSITLIGIVLLTCLTASCTKQKEPFHLSVSPYDGAILNVEWSSPENGSTWDYEPNEWTNLTISFKDTISDSVKAIITHAQGKIYSISQGIQSGLEIKDTLGTEDGTVWTFQTRLPFWKYDNTSTTNHMLISFSISRNGEWKQIDYASFILSKHGLSIPIQEDKTIIDS